MRNPMRPNGHRMVWALAMIVCQILLCSAQQADESTPQPTPQEPSDQVITISSLEGDANKRHHYEPQADSDVANSHKPEPRNQNEQARQDDQSDQVIVDHRPSGSDKNQPAIGLGPLEPTTTTQSPAVAQSYITGGVTGALQQSQMGSAQNGWIVSSSVSQPTQLQAAVQAPSSTNFAPATNQLVTIQAAPALNSNHLPSSINSIIHEQQQQQQNLAMSGSAPTAQVVSVNGQPASLILMNPNAINGGRRVSLSGWLRGISSMLANIFNRREHGAQFGNTQPSSPLAHWVQLGPNAPHWLSSLVQQQQQQQASSSNRFTTYLSPTGVQIPQVPSPSTMTISMQPAASQQITPSNHQQDLQASASAPASYLAIQAPNAPHQLVFTHYQPAPSSSPLPGVFLSSNSVLPIQTQANNNQNTRQAEHPNRQQVSSQPSSSSNVALSTQAPNTASTRFSRSSVSFASNQNQLPLAHYSRYGTPTTD